MLSSERPIFFRFRVGSGLALALAFTPAALTAQAADVCRLEGMRVRIHMAAGTTVTGSLLGCTDERLQVRPEDGDGGLSPFIDHFVPLHEILVFDVSRGFRKRVFRPVAIGASVVGALFGGFAYLTGEDGAPCGNEAFCVRLTRTRKTVAASIAGAMIGAGGGLVHGLTQEVEVWEPWPEVPLAHGMRVDARLLLQASGAVGARIVLRF